MFPLPLVYIFTKARSQSGWLLQFSTPSMLLSTVLPPWTKWSSQSGNHFISWSLYPSMPKEPLAQSLVSRRNLKALVERTELDAPLSRWLPAKSVLDGAWPNTRRGWWRDTKGSWSWRKQCGQQRARRPKGQKGVKGSEKMVRRRQGGDYDVKEMNSKKSKVQLLQEACPSLPGRS